MALRKADPCSTGGECVNYPGDYNCTCGENYIQLNSKECQPILSKSEGGWLRIVVFFRRLVCQLQCVCQLSV